MLTPNDDELLPCFDCAVLPDALGYRYICPTCGIAARKGETYAAMTEAWNRIQRALEALDDAERSADLEERKLQAFENLMDHPEWGPGR